MNLKTLFRTREPETDEELLDRWPEGREILENLTRNRDIARAAIRLVTWGPPVALAPNVCIYCQQAPPAEHSSGCLWQRLHDSVPADLRREFYDAAHRER
jgi:hypothetical protein